VAARDFFISYTSADRAWAEWIAWELEEAGYTTLIQAWDFRPGMNFVAEMQKGTAESSRTLIVLSQQFLDSGFTQAEWSAAFAKDPTGETGILIPVRVADCEPPGLLRARVYIDFVGLSEEEAFRRRLLDGVKEGRAKPATRPRIPETGTHKPMLPRAPGLTIHNLPFPPNPLFTGREAELEALHRGLQEQAKIAATQMVAVHGLGGVGKTQLAVQYAWKYLHEFDAVLWVRTDSAEALEASLAGLASVLRLPEAKEREQAVQIEAVLVWLRDHNRWLMIADNADTEAAVQAIRQRLPPSLPGFMFVTSRLSSWPLNLRQLSVDLFSVEEATRYLLARAGEREHEGGGVAAAQRLAEDLGFLPLALEQAASFIVEMRWSFAKYQEQLHEARLEILSEGREGGTHYPASVAKTWSMTLEQIGPLARSLLRLAAWFAPDAMPRGIFSADKKVLSEALAEQVAVTDLAIDKALGELDRFSLIRLTSEMVSVHQLLQAVEQDSLPKEECERWLVWAARLFNAFAPESPHDVRTWRVWLPLEPHAEALLGHMERRGVGALPIAVMANQFGLLLSTRGTYARAEPLFRRALEITEKALGPKDPEMAGGLNNLAFLYDAQGQYGKAEPLYERALAIWEEALGPEHPNVATGLSNLAMLYNAQGQYSRAEPFCQRALVIRRKVLDPEHPEVATSLNNLALLYDAQGQYSEAEPLYERALAIWEKALGPEHPNTAQGLNNLATVYFAQGQYGKAESLYERTLAILEKVLGPEHPKLAEGLNNLALLYNAQGQYGKAQPLCERALAIWEEALGPEHPNAATSLNNLAALYDAQGQYEKAEPLYERALAVREKALGREHPEVAQSLSNLAFLWYNQGRYAKAEPFYERALAIQEKALGLEHPNVATSLSRLALLNYSQGEYGKAQPLYERALAIREKALDPEHPEVAQSLNNLAALYDAQGRHGKAEPLYERALAIQEKAFGPEHPEVANSLNNLAALYHTEGRYEKAELLFERALAIREKTLGPEHPDVAMSLNNLASLYDTQGEYARAEPLYERAQAIWERALGPEHPNVAMSLNNLAVLFFSQSRYREAEPLYERALAIREKTLGPEHPDVARSLNNLAFLYYSQGEYSKAEPLYKRTLAIWERALGPQHPLVATCLQNYALLLRSIGREEEAVQLESRAEAIRAESI
jgi:tetratricopeptide (TPR) repeat protein